jgi:hypothetical protein
MQQTIQARNPWSSKKWLYSPRRPNDSTRNTDVSVMKMKYPSITIRSIRNWTGYALLLVLPGTLLLLPLAAWWLHRRGAAPWRAVKSSPQNHVIEGQSRDWRADEAPPPQVQPIRRKPYIESARFTA